MGKIKAIYNCDNKGVREKTAVISIPDKSPQNDMVNFEAAAKALNGKIKGCENARFDRFVTDAANHPARQRIGGRHAKQYPIWTPGKPCDLTQLPRFVPHRPEQVMRTIFGEMAVQNQLHLVTNFGAKDEDVCELVSRFSGWAIIGRLPEAGSYQLEYQGPGKPPYFNVMTEMKKEKMVVGAVSYHYIARIFLE